MKSLLCSIVFLLLFSSCIAQSKKGFDLSNAIIPISKILDGGPPKDGIPAIDNPKFLGVNETSLKDEDRVLGVFENGIAKAYPINILNFHEIVNDHFDSQPIVITYCPLCGSGIAFNAEINENPKTFGVSGLLYNSDVLLYDRETESLWSQLLFKAVAGPLVNQELEILATSNTTWKNWKNMHPESLVLSENTGYIRDYSSNPYPDYSTSSNIYFPVAEKDNRFHPKEMIIGVIINDKQKAYPFSELKKLKAGVLVDEFQDIKLRVKFSLEDCSAEVFDDNGNRVPAITNFWFAWYAFYPETEIFIGQVYEN